jgi:hypothetical protein
VSVSRIFWAALLVLLLVGNLVISAPARLLSLVVPGEQVLLYGLSGTVWRGSAGSAMLRLPQGYLHLGAVQWSLHPSSLVLLAPRLTVSSHWGSQSFTGDLVLRGRQDLDLFDVEAQLPAELLGQFAPVALQGNFRLELPGLSLRNGLPYAGSGRVVWQDGNWRSPRGPVPLGSYALDFEQLPGQALHADVITLAGTLQASGTVLLENKHYAIDIALGSDGNLDEQLQNMLSLIAVPQGDKFHIGMEGDF